MLKTRTCTAAFVGYAQNYAYNKLTWLITQQFVVTHPHTTLQEAEKKTLPILNRPPLKNVMF